MQCAYLKENTEQCKAQAINNSVYCFVHEPSLEAERADARRRGGMARKAPTLPVGASEFDLKTAEDVRAMLEDTINKVRTGQLDAKIANNIGYLSNQILRAIETTAIEKRLDALEKRARE